MSDQPEYPWRDVSEVWWGVLENDGRPYALIRRTPGTVYEVFDRRYSMTWQPDPEGAGHFTGIGGVTDAEPITAEEGERLLADYIAAGLVGDPDLR
jgi:hypothetical protein